MVDKHSKAIGKIASRPSIIGLTDIVASAVEVKLFDSHGNLVAEPDVILYSKTGDIYVIEYKDNGDRRLMKKAEEQLYCAVNWFSRNGISPKTMIVDGQHYPELKKGSKREVYDRRTVKKDKRR